MFECDGPGCGFTGTLEEVEAHIMGQDVDYDDLSTIKCWGAMGVGGPAWEAFHKDGIPPMAFVINRVSEAYFEFIEAAEGIVAMGDLEQYELNMLRRDEEVEQYEHWARVVEDDIKASTFETLLSWVEYREYCPRCGDYKKATKTSTNHEFYQYECGHYGFRWDNTHNWDEEIAGWIPKEGT